MENFGFGLGGIIFLVVVIIAIVLAIFIARSMKDNYKKIKESIRSFNGTKPISVKICGGKDCVYPAICIGIETNEGILLFSSNQDYPTIYCQVAVLVQDLIDNRKDETITISGIEENSGRYKLTSISVSGQTFDFYY